MAKPTPEPEQPIVQPDEDKDHPPQSQKPNSPPGREQDSGRGQEGAPGQNKPRPEQQR